MWFYPRAYTVAPVFWAPIGLPQKMAKMTKTQNIKLLVFLFSSSGPCSTLPVACRDGTDEIFGKYREVFRPLVFPRAFVASCAQPGLCLTLL